MCLLVTAMLATSAFAFAAEPGTDWDNQLITVTGTGVAPQNAVNPAQARMLARRAAVADGYRQLAEVVRGVQVDSETTVESMMVTSDIVKTKVSAMIQGARVVSERVVPGGGYEVTMQKFDLAMQDYDRAIALDSANAIALNNRGNLHSGIADYYHHRTTGKEALVQREYRLAEEDLTRALSVDSSYKEAFLNRANLYSSFNEDSKAVQDYTQAIALDPGDAKIYVSRGASYTKLDQDSKALADYTKALELKPDFGLAYNNRGRVYYGRSEYELAFNDFTKAKDCGYIAPVLLNNMGLVAYQLGRYDDAIDFFTMALSIDPNYKTALENMQIAYAAKGGS